jgi:hypothetical protein
MLTCDDVWGCGLKALKRLWLNYFKAYCILSYTLKCIWRTKWKTIWWTVLKTFQTELFWFSSSVLLRRTLVGDFLVALPSFKASSTSVIVIGRCLFMIIYVFYLFRDVTMTIVRISFGGDLFYLNCFIMKEHIEAKSAFCRALNFLVMLLLQTVPRRYPSVFLYI